MAEAQKKAYEQIKTPASEELKGMLNKGPLTLVDGRTLWNLSTYNDSLNKKLELLNVSDVRSLKKSSEYTGKKTEVIIRAEAVITAPGRGVDGIYTQDAYKCSILVAVSKDSSDNIKQVGLAHIDESAKKNEIVKFLGRVKRGSEVLEVHVIGGSKDRPLLIIESCEILDARIKFFRANLEEERVDAAVVDMDGNVYYGERKDLTDLMYKKIDEMLGSRTYRDKFLIKTI
jgi:hypothetical protein